MKYIPVNNIVIETYNSTRRNGSKEFLCYAPFAGLYFKMNGEVCVCCNTRQYIVGKYPDQSIEEIWTGEKIKSLRQLIRKNDLSSACEICNKQMKNGNFYNMLANYYDEFSGLALYPEVMEFELDNTCNLECIMCSGEFSSSIRSNREKKPDLISVYDKTFIRQLDKFIPSLTKAKFLGGEPFLSGINFEIWEHITWLNPACRIFVQTNATVLNENVKNVLAKTPFDINISIDTLNRSTYCSIRVNADFDKVMENIRYFIQYSKLQNTIFGISVCPMRINIAELPELMEFCNKNNIFIYFNSVTYPVQHSLDCCPSSELNEYYTLLSSYDFITDTVAKKHNMDHYQSLLAYLESRRNIMFDYENKLVANAEEFSIENRNKEKMFELLFRKIEVFLSNNNTGFNLEFYTEKLREIFSKLPDKYPLTRILNNICEEVPAEGITNDLEIETENVILDKIRAISVEVA